MTDGERMVWAAAFALALRTYAEGGAPIGEHARKATEDADMAVMALRAGGSGLRWREMVGR